MGRIHYIVVAAKVISVFLISFFLWNCAGNCRGNEKICTQIGCGDMGVSITLPDLKPGQYRLTITADNQRFQRYCTAEPEKTIEDSETNTVMHSGGPCSTHIAGRFKKVTVFLEGQKLGEYDPEYKRYYPNGLDCPGVCEGASLTIHTSNR